MKICCVFSLILIAFYLSSSINIKTKFNLKKLYANFIVKIGFIKLLELKIYIIKSSNGIKIMIRNGKKVKFLAPTENEKDKATILSLVKSDILRYFDLEKVELKICCGTDNPSVDAILIQFVKIVSISALCYLKNVQNVKTNLELFGAKSNFKLSALITIPISIITLILDLIFYFYSLFISKHKRKKSKAL